HMTFGRWLYWMFAIVSTVVLVQFLPQWALAQMIVFLLMGLYSELEQQKVSRFYSAMSSVAVSLLAVFFCLGIWAQSQNISLSTFLKKQVSSTMMLSPQMKALSSSVEMSQVVSVLPAFLAFLLMVLVFFGALFIRPLGKNDKMTTFQVPEYLIWVFTLALAGSFLLDPIKYFIVQKISLNVLFVSLCAYYFQGMAVLGFVMNRLRINYFLKVIIFFVMAFQLFVAVVALGLSDVWFGYRSRVFKNLIKNNPYAGD
ncbi:YybS family protein, partial [bacterium]|nr:YybS family protein [bacterium]